MGTEFTYAPVGTASSDYMEFTGDQLEVNGSASPSPVERLQGTVEAERQYGYFWQLTEAASDSTVYGVCQGGAAATTGSECMMTFPAPMRAAPTLAYTAGTITCTCNTAGAAAAVTALTITKASTLTANLAATGTSAATITGFLKGGNSTGGGTIAFSSEL